MTTRFVRLALPALVAVLICSGCAIPLQVGEGESTVGGAMAVTTDRGWNHLVVIDRFGRRRGGRG